MKAVFEKPFLFNFNLLQRHVTYRNFPPTLQLCSRYFQLPFQSTLNETQDALVENIEWQAKEECD